jgi:superfamily II DNA or RNA helicase
MILKQLNNKYFSEIKDLVQNFEPFKNSYHIIRELNDGEKLSDLDILILLFENSIPDDFFSVKSNLLKFCLALHYKTRQLIEDKFQLNRIEDINWTVDVSNYFIFELGLPEKFKYQIELDDKDILSTGVVSFKSKEIKFKRLKDYQSKIFYECFDYLKNTPFSRCIIQMPTGSGKTRTAMEIVCEIINFSAKNVLWLANTEELCDQAFDCFNEVWDISGHHNLDSVNHSSVNFQLKQEDEKIRFHVATLQSINSPHKFRKITEWGINSDNLALVVLDEAHIAIAPTYLESINNLLFMNAKLLGLSATPGRSIRKNEFENDVNSQLSDFFFNKIFKIGNSEISDIEYLRNKRILSNAKYHTIEGSTIENHCTNAELVEFVNTMRFPARIEKYLSNDAGRNASIINNLKKLLNEKKKILFFATSVNHSKLITALLKAEGFNSSHIDGQSGSSRRQIINDFKNGKILLLSNYGVLSTGFDDPKVDVVFIARKTNSIILYSQIIGRGLRGPEIGGTQICDIYTVSDNILGMPSNDEISSYFDEYFINKI